MKEYTDKLKVDFSFMSYVPFLFISAKTGQRVDKDVPPDQRGGGRIPNCASPPGA